MNSRLELIRPPSGPFAGIIDVVSIGHIYLSSSTSLHDHRYFDDEGERVARLRCVNMFMTTSIYTGFFLVKICT